MVFGSREMVSGHRSMVLPGSDMPSALGLVKVTSTFDTDFGRHGGEIISHKGTL